MQDIKPWLDVFSLLVMVGLIIGVPIFGIARRVPVYEQFVVGAREGFTTAVRIIPYLVAILFAIAMFRASGAMEFLQEGLRPVLRPFGIPPELLPMAIIRPLTGSGSAAVLADMLKQYGVGAPVVKMAATIYGSSETTFYTLAVYFGAVNIRKTRHAVPAGLIADIAGVFLAVWVINWLFR